MNFKLTIFKNIRFQLIFLLKKLLKLFSSFFESVERNEINGIVVFRTDKRLGNSVFILPLLNYLQKEFPNKKHVLFTNSLNEAWLSDYLEGWEVKSSGFKGFGFILRTWLKPELKLLSIDANHFHDPSISGSFWAQIIRDHGKVGHAHKYKGLFSWPIEIEANQYESLTKFQLLSGIDGKKTFSEQDLTQWLPLKKNINPAPNDEKSILLHLGASGLDRQIEDLPSSLITQLLKFKLKKVRVLGDLQQSSKQADLQNLWQEKFKHFDLEFTVPKNRLELFNMVMVSDYAIVSHSGPYHLCAAFGLATLVISRSEIEKRYRWPLKNVFYCNLESGIEKHEELLENMLTL